jgi:hypothetical protein
MPLTRNEDYVSPQESYDLGYNKGWNDGKDYWMPKQIEKTVQILKGLPFIWVGETQFLEISRADLIKLIDNYEE